MTPTPKLRFVERSIPTGTSDSGWVTGKIVRILQQWWEDRHITLAVLQYDKYGTPITNHPGEWRDVPVEKE
jgi:hypothetical protein